MSRQWQLQLQPEPEQVRPQPRAQTEWLRSAGRRSKDGTEAQLDLVRQPQLWAIVYATGVEHRQPQSQQRVQKTNYLPRGIASLLIHIVIFGF
jgi:hypothetical protein